MEMKPGKRDTQGARFGMRLKWRMCRQGLREADLPTAIEAGHRVRER